MKKVGVEKIKDLKVLNKAHSLVLELYEITKSFPDEEKYRLADQICRASASIPTNIAEGKARQTSKDFTRFLIISRGSVEEVKYLLLLSKDLNYISSDEYIKLMENYNEIGKMLNGLISSLK